MRVRDLLRRKGDRVVQVRPGTKLADVMSLMAKEKVGTVLVINEYDVLQGLISERDFVRIFTEIGAEALDLPVCDLTVRTVITCHEDATLQDLMTLMSKNGIRHLPAVRDGRVIGMMSARDVMDAQKDVLVQLIKRQKQAFNLALQAKEQAETSDHQKTEFLKRVGHELRTPLNAIIGFSALLEAETWGPAGDRRYTDYAGEINVSGNKLLTIINEILEMSRLELGEWDPKRQIVSLSGEFRRIVENHLEDADAKSPRLEIDEVPDNLGLMVDRFMLREMLDHIVGNGLKFTPVDGEVRISVSDDGPDGVCIVVSDTGRGIPADKIAQVTKPFCGAQDVMVQQGEGIGLGLALTDGMMSVLGGKLEIESTVGQGTTVTLRFPRDCRQTIAGNSTGHDIPDRKAAAG